MNRKDGDDQGQVEEEGQDEASPPKDLEKAFVGKCPLFQEEEETDTDCEQGQGQDQMGKKATIVNPVGNQIKLDSVERKGNIGEIPASLLQPKKLDSDDGDGQGEEDQQEGSYF